MAKKKNQFSIPFFSSKLHNQRIKQMNNRNNKKVNFKKKGGENI